MCNHKDCVNGDNIGYVQGMLEDNRPFEAELFLGNGECTLGVIMPIVDEIESAVARLETRSASCLKNEKGNVIGFVKQVETQDNGVLPIGMVELGETDDLDITCKYVDFLEGLGVVKFLTAERNGYIEYYNDIHGTELVRVLVILQYANGEVVATTPFRFRKFGYFELIDAYKENLKDELNKIYGTIDAEQTEQLDNEILRRINCEDIDFVEYAEAGACGTPGAIALYMRKDGKPVCYVGNYLYNNCIDEKLLRKTLKGVLNSMLYGNLTRGSFKRYNLGKGNYWYANRRYTDALAQVEELMREEMFGYRRAIAYLLMGQE